jgi:hypothetical protein
VGGGEGTPTLMIELLEELARNTKPPKKRGGLREVFEKRVFAENMHETSTIFMFIHVNIPGVYPSAASSQFPRWKTRPYMRSVILRLLNPSSWQRDMLVDAKLFGANETFGIDGSFLPPLRLDDGIVCEILHQRIRSLSVKTHHLCTRARGLASLGTGLRLEKSKEFFSHSSTNSRKTNLKGPFLLVYNSWILIDSHARTG